ncbi:hypothetical protein E1B28_002969 [Marasmius oreades]|uniref:Uncharacterized protein n=1 Tax=Marasmius oreades TaxID=181124 RepID=A0A9P7RM25_9AGAR|nr:uncharacterized protein E1B28_002969 [Marasmius oreades]KAG7085408.1 hypothetical protein E1B28_002969 [Marasmius oreades]
MSEKETNRTRGYTVPMELRHSIVLSGVLGPNFANLSNPDSSQIQHGPCSRVHVERQMRNAQVLFSETRCTSWLLHRSSVATPRPIFPTTLLKIGYRVPACVDFTQPSNLQKRSWGTVPSVHLDWKGRQ